MSSDDGIADAGDPQARLEQMKNEFLVAQQRRRDKAPVAAARPEDTDDGPLQAGPADGRMTAVAAVLRP